jgi:hypothetical protein
VAEGDLGATLTMTNSDDSSSYMGVILAAWDGAAAGQPDVITASDTGPSVSATYDSPTADTAAAGDWGIYYVFGAGGVSITSNPGTIREQPAYSHALADSNGSVGPAGTTIGAGEWEANSTTTWAGITIGLAAPAATNATVSGVTATEALAAPGGSVEAAASVAGAVATETLAAPAGTVHGGATAPGPAATETLAAPAGSVSAGAAVTGQTSAETLAAPAGTVAATGGAAVDGVTAAETLSAPAGAVSTGATLRAFPDVERAVCDLLAGLGATGTETPAGLQSQLPYIRVTRTGGSDDRVTDTATVSVDVFAADATTAKAVAGQARQRLTMGPFLSDVPFGTGHGRIDRARTVTGPQMLPASDGDNLRLAVASYSVALRR